SPSSYHFSGIGSCEGTLTPFQEPCNITKSTALPALMEMDPMSNPYTIRPVTAPEYFVPARGGRGTQARRILHNICRANPLPDSVSIVGERRFGKTSLLGYLQLAAANTPSLLMAGVDML